MSDWPKDATNADVEMFLEENADYLASFLVNTQPSVVKVFLDCYYDEFVAFMGDNWRVIV